jgi:hypothetical protein
MVLPSREGEMETAPRINIILEQYKLYVEMMVRMTDKRRQDSKYFAAILSGLFILASFFVSRQYDITLLLGALLLICCFAYFVTRLWLDRILCYKINLDAKAKVLCELEQELPYPCFTSEWDMKTKQKYKSMCDNELKLVDYIGKSCVLVFVVFAVLSFIGHIAG